jgi:hypothetical protein
MYNVRGGEWVAKVGGGADFVLLTTSMPWALTHGHLGGSGGMLPHCICECKKVKIVTNTATTYYIQPHTLFHPPRQTLQQVALL